ncbi:MAG TPA: tetratricopeptide repeat protein, partial [Ktedonobacteraceae bacterium]|nr:tetratricopeptide repeat protein [Ktedonobacteraceae bacterium]
MDRSLNHQMPLVVGREDLFQKLREMLQSRRLVVIAAPAGMGKTTFALEYARRFSQAYRWVFYMDVSSTETWLADALELAARLSLPVSAEKQNLAGVSEVLQNWFAQQPDYLLIMDNVGSAALAEPSEQTAAGHTLLLTRQSIDDPSFAQMPLAKLDLQQSTLLLLRQSGQLAASIPLSQAEPAVQATATTLAQAMDGLPLALNLAASSARVAGSSLQDLLTIYRTYEQRLVEHKTSKDRTTNAIAITCSLPAISLQKTQPFAAEVLWLCTVLAPGEIPRELFLQGASELAPALQEVAHNPALLDEALALLTSLGLLTMNETSRVLSMQRTVQETLRQAQAQEKRDGLVVQALRAFAHLLPAQEQATPAARMRTAAQILHLATLNSDWLLPHEPIADVFCWAATLLWEYGLIRDAEMLLRRALPIYQHLLGTGHETIGIVLRNLGTLNALLKNYSEAETLLQNALLARSSVLGATHPDVILCLLDLAGVYAEQGKREEARACYQEALKIGEPALGQDHPLLVVAAHKLAIFSLENGQFAEAETYYQRVLPLYEARLGLEDSTTQACMGQMATVY